MNGVRKAQPADIPQMLDLAEQRRARYESFQPRFWRRARDARARQAPHLRGLLASDDCIAFVYERQAALAGFIIGRLVNPPPVYDPGGPVCDVDEFITAQLSEWDTVGAALLRHVEEEARRRGAVLCLVVSGHRDQPKRSMLQADGLSLASEWWVREL